MWKKTLIIVGVIGLLIGLLFIVGAIQKSASRKALATYKADLQAQGEALTWQDLGYPPAGETNTSMAAFVSAVTKLGQSRPRPHELELMSFIGPGIVQAGWSTPHPAVSASRTGTTNSATWEEFTADMNAASNALAAIRTFLQNPPTYFPRNLTNPAATIPRNPFAEKRTAAQWLSADSLAALHQDELERSHADLHALAQMVQLHRDDISLVNAMIRVAITGLGLSATWEALQTDGWDENTLAQLQRDWEAIDLIDVLEKAMVGERVMVLQFFENPELGQALLAGTAGGPGVGRSSGLSQLRDDLINSASATYWRGHAEEDQLFYLQIKQQDLQLLRQLKTNAPSISITKAMQVHNDEWQSEFDGLLAGYRHLLSSVAIPNYSRALETTVRNETQRRMTVTAIALKRYKLKHGKFPDALTELVPVFVSSMPIDAMSGQPFGYCLNTNGTFTLYSVGEDGIDDGGDYMPPFASKQFDLWSGKDAVWPRSVVLESTSEE